MDEDKELEAEVARLRDEKEQLEHKLDKRERRSRRWRRSRRGLHEVLGLGCEQRGQ